MSRSRVAAVRTSGVLCLPVGATLLSAQAPPQPPSGRTRILVQLRLPAAYVPEGRLLNPTAVAAQRRAIDGAAARVLSGLDPAGHRLVRRYATGTGHAPADT